MMEFYKDNGLTARDVFAALALPVAFERGNREVSGDTIAVRDMTLLAYEIADWMMVSRAESPMTGVVMPDGTFRVCEMTPRASVMSAFSDGACILDKEGVDVSGLVCHSCGAWVGDRSQPNLWAASVGHNPRLCELPTGSVLIQARKYDKYTVEAYRSAHGVHSALQDIDNLWGDRGGILGVHGVRNWDNKDLSDSIELLIKCVSLEYDQSEVMVKTSAVTAFYAHHLARQQPRARPSRVILKSTKRDYQAFVVYTSGMTNDQVAHMSTELNKALQCIATFKVVPTEKDTEVELRMRPLRDLSVDDNLFLEDFVYMLMEPFFESEGIGPSEFDSGEAFYPECIEVS